MPKSGKTGREDPPLSQEEVGENRLVGFITFQFFQSILPYFNTYRALAQPKKQCLSLHLIS